MMTEKKKPEDKLPPGRPGDIKEAEVAKLEYAFSIGCSDLESCLHAGISKDTLYRYQRKFPEFRNRKELLKEKLVLVARTNVASKLKAKDPDMSKWYLERKMKSEFSTRTETTGQDGGPIQQVSFTQDEIRKLADEMRAE